MNYDNGALVIDDGKEIRYRIEGTGERKVILLHGLNSHSGTWRKTFPALVDSFTVLAPSLPPHVGNVSVSLVEQYADYVWEMCRLLRIGRASVIGNSMGGWIGMRLATRCTKFVSKIVFEDTAGARSTDADGLISSGAPILIVWGEQDDILPVVDGQTLHSRLPGSDFVVLSEAGHVPHWDRPDRFNVLVRDFLERSEE